MDLDQARLKKTESFIFAFKMLVYLFMYSFTLNFYFMYI